MVAMNKSAFGALFLLVTLAICRAAQPAVDAAYSYVYLGKSGTQAGKPSSGEMALTLEVSGGMDKARLCYHEPFQVVETHVTGVYSGSWQFDFKVPGSDGDDQRGNSGTAAGSSGSWAVGSALPRSNGDGQHDNSQAFKIICHNCDKGCVEISVNSPLVRTVIAYGGLLESEEGFQAFKKEDSLATSVPIVWERFDLLTYEVPDKKTTSQSTLIVPKSVALKTYRVESRSTGATGKDADKPYDMACLQPLDARGGPLKDTIWYWSTGPATGTALLSVTPEASRKDKVPNGCIKYDQAFTDRYLASGAKLDGKVIWVATGGGTGTTIKLDGLRFKSE